MTDQPPILPAGQPDPHSFVVLYQTADGRTRVQCRFEAETVWLTQALMAELLAPRLRTSPIT